MNTKTTVGTVLIEPRPFAPRPSGGDGSPVEATNPASTSPMNRMNNPIPAVIASFNGIGTASKISLRRPLIARATMIRPLMTTSPIASGQVSEPTTELARNELMPSPAANANGSRAMTPNRIVMTPAASDVTAETWVKPSWLPVDVGGTGQDDRVQHDDVGHRDERDDPAAQLGGDGRTACGYLEEPIEACHGSTLR